MKMRLLTLTLLVAGSAQAAFLGFGNNGNKINSIPSQDQLKIELKNAQAKYNNIESQLTALKASNVESEQKEHQIKLLETEADRLEDNIEAFEKQLDIHSKININRGPGPVKTNGHYDINNLNKGPGPVKVNGHYAVGN